MRAVRGAFDCVGERARVCVHNVREAWASARNARVAFVCRLRGGGKSVAVKHEGARETKNGPVLLTFWSPAGGKREGQQKNGLKI